MLSVPTKSPVSNILVHFLGKSISTGAEEIVQWLRPRIVLAEDMTGSQLTDSMTQSPPTPPRWILQCCWNLKTPSLTCTTLPTDIHISKMIFKINILEKKM